MGNAADTLVAKYPTRVAQLKKPVIDYLKTMTGGSQNGTEQDLYMSVFYPAYRRVSPGTEFPADVRRNNPGIDTVQDYIDKVNGKKTSPVLSAAEWTALKDASAKLGMKSWQPLYKLINFESNWNPQASNPSSGARGLIQFMPSTALAMGYKKTVGGLLLITAVFSVYYFGKKFKLF